MTIICLGYIYFVYKLDLSSKKLFSLSAFIPLLLLGVTFDFILLGKLNYLMVNDVVVINLSLFIHLNIILISAVIAVLFTNNFLKIRNNRNPYISNKSKGLILKIFRTMSLFVLLAFLINFNRVGFAIDLLLVDPRRYELLFGKYTAINYIYFLNVLVVFLFVYLHHAGSTKKIDILLFFLVLVSSLFFGHKSAFLDVLLVVVFSYVLLEGINKRVFVYLAFGFSMIILYFEFVRGGGFEGIFEYFLQGYLNFFYKLNSGDFVYQSFPLFVSSVFGVVPVESEILLGKIEKGFVLNEKFNTFTGFYEPYGTFSYLGWFVFFVYLYFLIFYFSVRRDLLQFIAVVFAWLLLLSFFSFRLSATKYQYLIFVVIVLHIFVRSLKVGRVSEKNS